MGSSRRCRPPATFIKAAEAGARLIRDRMRQSSFVRGIFSVPVQFRTVVVERSDGRLCWLTVGLKQPLTDEWNIFPEKSRCRTVCDDVPRVVRPSKSESVTCLGCLAAGKPRY